MKRRSFDSAGKKEIYLWGIDELNYSLPNELQPLSVYKGHEGFGESISAPLLICQVTGVQFSPESDLEFCSAAQDGLLFWDTRNKDAPTARVTFLFSNNVMITDPTCPPSDQFTLESNRP